MLAWVITFCIHLLLQCACNTHGYVHAHTRDGAVKQSNFYYRSTVCVYMVCGRAMRTYEISSSTSVLLVLSASDKARAPALLSPLKARFSLRNIWFDYKVVRESSIHLSCQSFLLYMRTLCIASNTASSSSYVCIALYMHVRRYVSVLDDSLTVCLALVVQ